MAANPTAAFILSLIGGVLMLISALLIFAGGAVVAAVLGPLGGIVIVVGLLHLIFAILVIV